MRSNTRTRKEGDIRLRSGPASEAVTCELESAGQSWGISWTKLGLWRNAQMEKRVTNSSGFLGPEGLPGT